MKGKTRSYQGDGITVDFDPRRCIHAAECVRGLPQVFDAERRPWIDPHGAGPAEIAEVVKSCPSGALEFREAPGVEAETPPAKNTATVIADGPIYLHGDLVFVTPDGEEVREVRAALCRCGDSGNKPFCDNTHVDKGFADSGAVTDAKLAPLAEAVDGGTLRITQAANGPLLVQGPLELRDGSGETVANGAKGALCRCGASANKPFCDGSHVAIGFEAEG